MDNEMEVARQRLLDLRKAEEGNECVSCTPIKRNPPVSTALEG